MLLVKGIHVSTPAHQAVLHLCGIALDSRPVDLPQVHVLDSVSRACVDVVNGVLDHLDPVAPKAKELHGGDFSDLQQPAPGRETPGHLVAIPAPQTQPQIPNPTPNQ